MKKCYRTLATTETMEPVMPVFTVPPIRTVLTAIRVVRKYALHTVALALRCANAGHVGGWCLDDVAWVLTCVFSF